MLGVAFDIPAAVDPAALVAARLDVVEELRLKIALVGLEALAALGIARLLGVDRLGRANDQVA